MNYCPTPGKPAALFPNTPNPFDQRTEIAFAVSRPADITISLFDATGQRISTLVSGRYGTGEYHIPVDGASLEPGIYFCVMHSNTGLPSTQKWVVLR
ncbi:MAG: T9SS type A sorting domain-containing protein [Saprospirales bacterium]|nr:T9SS type A sorting domain-containing protein [Saprospirales bacterium]